jgi:hypothetical protein
VSLAEDWPWSSARAHLAGEDDKLATVAPLRALIPNFPALLTAPTDPATMARIERTPTIGRPLGAPEWIAALERQLGRRRTFGTATESDQCLGAQRGKGLASADSLTSSRRIVTCMVT